MSSPTINTLTSFSGADLVVSFANQVIGELQQLSWAIQREKAPVFTLGSADARSFSRGKRGIAGSMVFAVFDHDSLVNALQHVWDKIAPPAMFTAAGNHATRGTENFMNALDMLKWNVKTTNAANGNFSGGLGDVVDAALNGASNSNPLNGLIGATTGAIVAGVDAYKNPGYGFSGSTAIHPNKQEGSNGAPASFDAESNYFVETWNKGDEIYVPAGFEPMRGSNILYADSLPPFDITLTFANEYGQCAFQKIYDVDILNESSGVSVDTVVMERHMTYIARRLSPLVRGVYNREAGGNLKGLSPTSK